MCEIPVPGCCVCCWLCQDAVMGLPLVLSAPVPLPLLAFPTEHPKVPGLSPHPKRMCFFGMPFPIWVSHRGCPGWAMSIPAPRRAVGVQGSCGCPRVPPQSCWRNPPQGAQESGSGMRQHHPSAAWGSSEQTSPWHRVRHSPTAAAFSSRSQAPR